MPVKIQHPKASLPRPTKRPEIARRARRAPRPAEEVAVVTVYFNPCGYRSRFENYVRFLDSMGRQQIDVSTIEITAGLDSSQLTYYPNVTTVQSSSVLWHKERAINRMVELLPAQFSKVAWVDCDLLWPRAGWLAEVSELLEDYPVAQLFSEIVLERPDGSDGLTRPSWAAARAAGDPRVNAMPPGGAWAARRELFSHFGGLYDRLLSGGADCLTAAAFDEDLNPPLLERCNDAVTKDFQRWATPVARYVRGDVGCLNCTVRHLWHGERENKQYRERMKTLLEFDPETDIQLNKSGLWEWATEKPSLHDGFRKYFQQRKEDG